MIAPAIRNEVVEVVNPQVCVPRRRVAASNRSGVQTPSLVTEILLPATLILPTVPSNANTVFDETLFTDGFSIRDRNATVVFNKADRYLAERLGKKVVTVYADNFSESFCQNTGSATAVSDDEDGSSRVNVNPLVPCVGLNVYTMNAENKPSLRSVSYSRVVVLPAGSKNPLLFSDVLQTEQRNSDYGTSGRVVVPPNEIGSNVIVNDATQSYDNDGSEQVANANGNAANVMLETVPIGLEEPRANAVYTVSADLSPFEMAVMVKYYAIQGGPVFVTEILYHNIVRFFADKRKWFDRSSTAAEKLTGYTIRNGYCELVQNGTLLNVPNLAVSGPPVTV